MVVTTRGGHDTVNVPALVHVTYINPGLEITNAGSISNISAGSRGRWR